jgi:hypothetical protein
MMRAVVREPGGLIGSADRRLEVRPLTGPDVSASDLILGSASSLLPVRARAHVDDGLTGVIETYARTGAQLDDVSVRLDLIPMGSDTPAASARGELMPLELSGNGVLRRAEFRLPLGNLPPGEYLARATVRSGTEAAAQVVRQLEVVAGTATPSGPIAAPEQVRARDILQGDVVVRYTAALKAGKSSPASQQALLGLDLFARERYAEAAEALNQALDLDRTSAATAFVAGWASAIAGDHRRAISAWRAAAALDPTMVSAHLALADGYLRINEPALAIQSLRAGLKAMPDSAELQSRLAAIEKEAASSKLGGRSWS